MTRPLDVLVIESQPGAAAPAIHDLEAAGHRVHGCYDDGSRGFPCHAVIEAARCPLAGHIDVALVVRPGVAPHATALEQGVTCALRAGVPVVEQGPVALDPYEPFLSTRVDDDVAAACEAASAVALDELRREILRLAEPMLAGAGILAGQTACRIEPTATRLQVTFDLPVAVPPAVKQALAVRVLDAVRRTRRTYGPVEVSVHDRSA